MANCKVIAVTNQKGGVGKTTTTANLGIDLSGMEIRLINAMSRESVLRTYINAVKPHYDYILIDCMPSLGMMPINSLAAADSVIIPSQPSFLSAKGLDLLMQSIAKVKRQINSKLMSGEISTYLTGRYLSIPVFTLSFSEYLEFKKDSRHTPKELLNEYILAKKRIFPFRLYSCLHMTTIISQQKQL